MPTLDKLPDLFAGYDPESTYVSIPPVVANSLVGENIADGDKLTLRTFALQDFQNFSSIARGVMAKQAIRSGGVPAWTVDAFKDVFTKIPLVQGEDLVSFAVKKGVQVTMKALSDIAEDVSEALSAASSSLPMVGAVVQFGISLASTIRMIVAEERKAKSEGRPLPEFPELVYDEKEDNQQGRLLLAGGGEGDWTDVFMPTDVDPDFIVERIPAMPGTYGFSWRTKSVDGYGLLPGLNTQLRVFQSVDGKPAVTDGDRLPSGRKFAMMLWQAAMKPSVQMFQIDSHKLQDAWDGYFTALWKLGDRDFSDLGIPLDAGPISPAWRVRQSASYSAMYPCAGAKKAVQDGFIPNCIVGGKNEAGAKLKPPVFEPESIVAGFSRQMLAKKVKVTGLYSDIVNYVSLRHRERARSTLGTLVVAYVPSDAPLLKADPELAALHKEMRQLLLSDMDRYAVEIDLVPSKTADDKAWRAALDASTNPGVAATWKIQSIKGGGSGPKKKPGIPPAIVGTFVPPMPPPPPLGLPNGIGGHGTGLVHPTRTQGGGLLLVGAAAAAAGYLLLRKKSR
jgi:hypothetical protein